MNRRRLDQVHRSTRSRRIQKIIAEHQSVSEESENEVLDSEMESDMEEPGK